MQVLVGESDLSDSYLRFASQLGVGGFDIHDEMNVPGIRERGYADAAGVRQLLERLRCFGLELHRVTPARPMNYLYGRPNSEIEVDHMARTLEALGQAGARMMLVPLDLFHAETNTLYGGLRIGVQRGGYKLWAFDGKLARDKLAGQPFKLPVDPDVYFERCVRIYERLVPIAEAYDVRLILHPSDPQLPFSELSPERWFGLIEAVPSPNNGLLYCVGTRYEIGADVHADIRALARQGKLFHVHFRNVRGTIPTVDGYEETDLNDGDMNMFHVLRTLHEVGYDGGLQVDHLPVYDGDTPYMGMATAYAVGYIKALLRALEA